MQKAIGLWIQCPVPALKRKAEVEEEKDEEKKKSNFVRFSRRFGIKFGL